jgi:hypothetical protein
MIVPVRFLQMYLLIEACMTFDGSRLIVESIDRVLV